MGSKASGNRTANRGHRRPRTATLRENDFALVSDVSAEGYCDLGRGSVEIRRADSGGRVIVVRREDGGEIRIVVLS